MTLPYSSDWFCVNYGNGLFTAIALTTNKGAYSTDGINWTETTLPYSLNWRSICYGDGKYIAIANGTNKAAYAKYITSFQELLDDKASSSEIEKLKSTIEELTSRIAALESKASNFQTVYFSQCTTLKKLIDIYSFYRLINFMNTSQKIL